MKQYIFIITKNGKSIKIPIEDLKSQHRGGLGVRAMIIEQGDEVVSAVFIEEK